MFARSDIYFRLYLLLIIITTTCISLSLRRTSAPIHLTSVSGMLGTQEAFCIVIAGLLERDSFDLLLAEFDKPWVIHLRETCCCSTNLCPLCTLDESVQHLLLSCHRARDVWRLFRHNFTDRDHFTINDLLSTSFTSFEASTIATTVA
jgi:hypothetical protein